MHILSRPRPDESIVVKLDDGRLFKVRLIDGSAHVPDAVGRHMCERGYCVPGPDPNPKPEFERVGNGWGALKPMFARWCEQIVTPPKDQPEAKETGHEQETSPAQRAVETRRG